MHLRLIILTISFLAFLLAHPAPAKVIYVSQDATGDGSGSSWENACTTITAGLVASASGDEIWVKSATYHEAIEMKHGVALYGGFIGTEIAQEQRDLEANETVIDATGLNTHVVVGADFAVLDGFRITGGSAVQGGGVYCDNTSPSLINCRITGNKAVGGGGGLYLTGESRASIINCVVARNRSSEWGAGAVRLSPYSILANCTVMENWGSYCVGGVFRESDHSRIVNCVLWNESGELLSPFYEGSVNYSCVRGSWPGEGNFGADPQFVDPDAGDYRLQNGSPCIDRGLVAEAPASDIGGKPRPGGDGKVDIGAYESPDEYEPTPPGTYYVRADAPEGGDGLSWDTAFRSIQVALNAAEPLDEVWVARGTYREAIELNPDRALYGGFEGTETERHQRDWQAHSTIIDASGMNANAVTGDFQTTLDGFVVIGPSEPAWRHSLYGAFGTVANCAITGQTGSEIHGCSTLINCTFSGSEYPHVGLEVKTAETTLIDCIFSGNSAGVVFLGNSTRPDRPYTATLVRCTISDNLRSGVGFTNASNGILLNCTITGNEGHGVWLGFSSASPGRVTLEGCTITGNLRSGVCSDNEHPLEYPENIDCSQHSPTLTNCLIAGNGEYGLYCTTSTPVVRYCTIADNALGGIYVERHHFAPYTEFWDCDGFPSISDCVLWNSTSVTVVWQYFETVPDEYDFYELVGEEFPPPGQGLEMTYSCVQDGWPDTGNIDTDPLFVNPGSGDYHLQPGSPCIDSASTTGPDLDLDGHLRPVDIPSVGRDGPGAYDMGTYEFGSVPPTPTPTMTPTPTLSPTPTDTPAPPTATPTALPSTTPIPGDLNNDGTVNHTDLLLFQEHWHKSVTPIPTP